MKPIRVVIGIVAGTLLFLAFLSGKRQFEFSREAAEINSRIVDIRSMGYATNGDEYLHKIPDSENAWIDVGPILVKHEGTRVIRPFISRYSSQLLDHFSRTHLPLIHDYLLVNHDMRATISDALARKPRYQIQVDYDYGFGLLESDQYAQLAVVIREFCLAAAASAAENRPEECLGNLRAAIRLSNELIDMNRPVSSYAAGQSQIEIFRVGFLIAEQAPEMASQVESIMTDSTTFHHSDPVKLAGSVFLDQIASLRHYDDPSVDQALAPYPLSLLNGNQWSRHTLADCPVRHGNYIPESKNERKFFLKKLNDWSAGFATLRNFHAPSDIAKVDALLNPVTMWAGLPYPLQALATISRSPYPDYRPYEDHVSWEINLALWKAIAMHRRTSRFPLSVKDIGIEMPWNEKLKEFGYRVNKDSISFVQKSSTFGSPLTLGFPPSQVKKPQSFPLIESEVHDWIERSHQMR